MGANIAVAWMIVAACLLGGVQHLLAWHGRADARDHAWFAMVCLATAGAAAVYATAAPCAVACLAAIVWSMAASGFIAAHSPAPSWQRHAAWWVPALAMLSFAIGPLELTFDGTPVEPQTRAILRALSIVVGGAACALLVLLGIDAMRGEWMGRRRARAIALSGIAIAALGWSGLHAQPVTQALQVPALCVLFVSILAMAVELADTIADAQTVSQGQRQELAHASRLAVVGELTASIAHEINQPLGAILSNADAGEILLEGPDPPLDEFRKILADIRRDGLRASDVIRQVRTMVRKRELDLQPLDANVLTLDVAQLLEDESRRRRIALLTELVPHPVPLQGDRAMLEQMLINLVHNAMDAVEAAVPDEDTFRPPVILRVADRPHGEIEWRVVDAGIGVPDDKLDRLFDSFYTSKPHGMGLGLSIARSIIVAHGGRILAANNPGAGATFRVILRGTQAADATSAPAVRRPSPGAGPSTGPLPL